MARFPQRPASHIAGDEAIRIFLAACPKEWVPSVVDRDYGIDLRIEISQHGEVTGEEFYVQVKGRGSINSKNVAVNIPQPTINYWLGKLHPLMIVAADLSRNICWFDWLENAYREYPHQQDRSDPVVLHLSMNTATHVLGDAVNSYLRKYFSALRRDIAALSDTGQLAKFLLHVSALARACARMAMSLKTKRDWKDEEVESMFHGFFLEFGIHDQFLWSLWEKDSDWRRPLSGRVHAVLASLLDTYLKTRAKFWMREDRRDAADVQMVPVRYSDLFDNLIPTLDALWELEEALTELIVLGRFVLPDAATQSGPE